MCNLQTSWADENAKINDVDRIKTMLQGMVEDDLIAFTDSGIIVKEEGRPFVRNVCMPFDKRMIDNEPETRIFSMTI